MTAPRPPRPADANQSRYVWSELAGIGSYMIAVGHRVEGALDPERLRTAAAALVRRHDALRSRFRVQDGVVLVEVVPDAAFRFHHATLPDDSFAAFRAWALPLVFGDVDPRDAGSLIRVLVAQHDATWRFTIAAHHATTDGFSRGVMARELLKLYAGEELPPAPSYYDPVEPDADAATASLEEFVAALPRPARVVGDGLEDADAGAAGRFVERAFPDLSTPLRVMAKSVGATKFGVLAACYGLGLHGLSQTAAVSTFFQSEGRKALGASNATVGPYSRTLPLDLSVELDLPFAAYARAVTGRTKSAVALEQAPVLEAVIAAGTAPSVSINLFPPTSRIVAGDLVVGPREFLDRRTEFDLNLVWAEDRGVMTARAFHDPSQLSEVRVGLFLDQQARLIAAILERPDASCRDILALARAGDPAAVPARAEPPAPRRRLHAAFFDRAARTPDAPAVMATDGVRTYRAVEHEVRRYLAGLRAAGVAEGDSVVVYTQRSPDLVAAMLAVSASGAAMAVIDASHPEARVRLMVDRLKATALIEVDAACPAGLRRGMRVVRPSDPPAPEPLDLDAPARAVACHLFTSGTTGAPKLISQPDATVQRFVAWQAQEVALAEPIVTFLMSGLGHDPMLRDILLPLSHGGAVAVPTPDEMQDPAALRRLLRQAGCNVIRCSPALARLIAAGASEAGDFAGLRAIFWGGERLPPAVVAEWRARAPAARQFNVFGTTETPQAFLIHELRPGAPRLRDLPIGTVLPWTGARIAAEDGSTVAIGEAGELVAELADPVQGANDRFAADPGAAATRHFTGDLAYMMPGGVVTYAGRLDGQVKINGFRVELAEIEAIAETVEGVRQAVALMVGDRIALFGLSGTGAASPHAIRATLAQHLPGYMVPSQVLILDRLPSTPNGKTDKAELHRLAEEAARRPDVAASGAPEGEVEAAIAAILAQFSGRREVARGQSLADLGADSLATIEARLALEAQGLHLPGGWPWLSVADLAAAQPTGAGAAGAGGGWLSRIDTFIALRALAILAVVAFHAGLRLPLGATLILFVLAGYSFGTMQLPAILRDDHAGRVLALLARLVVPLVPISAVYFLKSSLEGDAYLSTILPYRNMAELFHDAVPGERGIPYVWLWFLHGYIQMFAAIGLLLALPWVRSALRADPWRGLAAFTLVSMALAAVAATALAAWAGAPVGTLAHLDHWPTATLPFLAIGALAATARTGARILATAALALGLLGLSRVVSAGNGEVWWLLALGLCVAAPRVTLPAVLAGVLIALAAHSLMIYLTHAAFAAAFREFAGASDRLVPVSVAIQLAGGVLLGRLIRPGLRALGVERLASVRVSFARPMASLSVRRE